MTKQLFTFWLLTGLILGFQNKLFAQPTNDDLCNAAPLYIDSVLCGGSPNGNNTGSTSQTGEPFGSCFAPFGNMQSVWFTFTGDSSGFVDIVIQPNIGSLFLAGVAVYQTTDTCNNLSALQEIACGVTGFGGTGTVISNLAAPLDSVFYIQVVGATFNPEGDFCIEVLSSLPPPPPPNNDSICQATVLSLGDSCDLSTPNGNLDGATTEVNEPAGFCFFNPPSNTVWFSFVGPDSTDAILNFTDIDAGVVQMAVYELPTGQNCTNPQSLVEVACELAQAVQAISVPTDSGSIYYVQISSLPFGTLGSFCLELAEAEVLTNDQPCGAIMTPVDGLTYSHSSLGATVDAGEQALAPPLGSDDGQWIENSIDGTIWFQFVAPPGGAVEMQFCHPGTNYDTQVAVYSASDCNDYSTFTLLAANDDIVGGCYVGAQFASFLEACFTPGDTFLIMVDGFSGEQGNLEMSLTEVGSSPVFASLLPSPPDCPGSNTGSIQVNATGGSGGYSYLWSNGDTSATLSGVMPGNYTVTVSDACGTSFTDSAIIGEAALLLSDAGADQVICIGDSVRIGGMPTAIGGNPFSTSSGLFGIVDGLGGDMWFTHPVSQPNQATTFGTINGILNGGDFTPQGFLAIDAGSSTLVEVDTTTGATTTIGTVTPSAGHTWTGLAYNAANDTLYGVSTNGLNGRIYYIDPTDGTTAVGPFLTASQPLWLAISTTGEAYIQDAATDSLFSVNLADGIATSIASPGFATAAIFRLDGDVDPGSGMLYFFNEGGFGFGSDLLVLNPATNVVSTVGTLGVPGSTRAFAIAGGNAEPYSYSWSPAMGLLEDSLEMALVAPDSSREYVVTVTDACGTAVSDTMSVEVNVQFSLEPGSTGGVGLGGSSVNIISGTAPFSYSWNTGDTTASISDQASGIYTVTVTDAMGCENTQSIEIWATAIDDLKQASIQTLNIYPNPASQQFFIDLKLDRAQDVQLVLYDLQGRQLWTKQATQAFDMNMPVPVDQLADGMYLLQLSTAAGSIQKRIVVRR